MWFLFKKSALRVQEDSDTCLFLRPSLIGYKLITTRQALTVKELRLAVKQDMKKIGILHD